MKLIVAIHDHYAAIMDGLSTSGVPPEFCSQQFIISYYEVGINVRERIFDYIS